MIVVTSFENALAHSLADTQRYLLLGNGFSTALYPKIFSYKSLLEEADFEDRPLLHEIFQKLGTADFEKVIRALDDTRRIIQCYGLDKTLQRQIGEDGELIKKALVTTIASRHPKSVGELWSESIRSCNDFLEHFRKIYSLNYDVLLYWVLLSGQEKNPYGIDDGFRMPDNEFGADYRVFDSPHSPTFYYLHGGLHLFDSGSDTRKYVWADTGKPIIQQVGEALDNGLYPLFVAEGTSKQKLAKINHNGYLSKALRSFEAICDLPKAELFIFGHSLDQNDDHVINKIRKGRIGKVFVSAYSDGTSGYDSKFVAKAKSLGRERGKRYPLEVILFDATSAQVWSKKYE